eukprot:931846-Rhodomonas_salina.1
MKLESPAIMLARAVSVPSAVEVEAGYSAELIGVSLPGAWLDPSADLDAGILGFNGLKNGGLKRPGAAE